MELWRWDCETNRVLILNTRGKLPDVQERGLLLCRSLTLPAERLLLGPTAWEPCPRFLRIDWEYEFPQTVGMLRYVWRF